MKKKRPKNAKPRKATSAKRSAPKKMSASRCRPKLSPRAKKFLRREIRSLMRSGYDQKRAIAAAYGMARAHGYSVPAAPVKAKNPGGAALLVTELVGNLATVTAANPSDYVNKLELGQVVCWKDLPESQKTPKARSTALRAAREQGIPLEQLKGEVCRGPRGVAPHTISSGELVRFAYKAPLESSRAHAPDGRRIVWDHAAGDHGKGKKKTKPCLVATDPETGLPIFLARRGSKPGLTPRGHVG